MVGKLTDAHCHLPAGEARHFLCEPLAAGATIGERDVLFVGVHPWLAESSDPAAAIASLRLRLRADSHLGVGEIGLDRLRNREISVVELELFRAQLRLAAEYRRPVVLHGAKCWGRVVKEIRETLGAAVADVPAFLFHGFSRSDGLLPDIVRLNGFVSVSAAVLNDHAVNYRELVKRLPADRLLVESDRTAENAAEVPSVKAIAAKAAELRGVDAESFAVQLETNADTFVKSLL